MVEATTGWLEMYPLSHATDKATVLGLEKQVLWQRGISERNESDNGTNSKNGLINTGPKSIVLSEYIILSLMHQPLRILNGTMDY